jgi:hypothetical protein
VLELAKTIPSGYKLHSCWQWRLKKFSIIIQRFYYTMIIEIFHVVMSFSGGFSNNKIGSSIFAHV